MADDNQDNVLSATFPAPPPFWKHFTPENRARLTELRDDAKKEDADMEGGVKAEESNDFKIPDLSAELRYLVPPAPPATGKYRSFGDPYDINEGLPSLKDMDIEQLYPSPSETPASPSGTQSQWTLDRAFYLKKMTQSLLLNYLEMVGVLSVDPMKWQDKYDHLQTLLLNTHHLINEYRPHQARASLIMMMEDQLRKKKEEVEGVKKMREKVDAVLAGLSKDAVDAGNLLERREANEVDFEELRKREQRAVLRSLDDELIAD